MLGGPGVVEVTVHQLRAEQHIRALAVQARSSCHPMNGLAAAPGGDQQLPALAQPNLVQLIPLARKQTPARQGDRGIPAVSSCCWKQNYMHAAVPALPDMPVGSCGPGCHVPVFSAVDM